MKITALLNKKSDLLLTAVFVVLICLPLVVTFSREDALSSDVERRNLAQLPTMPRSLQAIQAFPSQMESYYSDQFGFRNELTEIYFNIFELLSSDSPGKNITAGKDGWLFLGSIKPGYAGYADPIGDVMNVNRYTQEQLETFATYITAIRDWLAQREIRYVFVITPHKHSIYKDKLPDFIEPKHPISATDQLVDYLREHTDITLVDMREAMRSEREVRDVYFKLDSHWNSYGANVGQYEIMKAVEQLFPEQTGAFKLPEDEFTIGFKTNGDLAYSAGMVDAREASPEPDFPDGCLPERDAPNPDSRAPFTMICEGEDLNAVIFRDSYFSALVPYIARQFHRSTYIWNRLNYTELTEFIDRENPDLVIDQVVERVLPYVPYGQQFVQDLQQ